MSTPLTLAALEAGPIQFDEPVWLLLIPVLWIMVLVIGRKSIAGLGRGTRWVALAVRLIVIALVAGAIAEPHSREVSESVSVTFIVDESRSIPNSRKAGIDRYIEEAALTQLKSDDLLGVVTAAEEAYVQALPSTLVNQMTRQFIGSTDGTNLGEAARLGLAVAPEDAANRMVIISDGNETAGSLLAAAQAAKALGVTIDVLPVNYDYVEEVIVESLLAPATARGGETISLRVIIYAMSPAVGRLLVTENGHPVDLDPDSDSLAYIVELDLGRNVISVPVAPKRPGPQTYEAIFEPIGGLVQGENGPRIVGRADTLIENNRAMGVTFVGAEGFVLVVSENADESAPLVKAMLESELRPELISADRFPSTLTELNRYEAVVLVNEPAYNFSAAAQNNLRQYVHDSGGGLVMTGGPDSFGAGGWIGSALEDVLPVRLDPPQKRQMPRGALAMVMHSIEMPQGVFYGKQVARAAVDALSRLDLVGIIEFNFAGGTDWVYPISPVGDTSSVKRAINRLNFGDMPSFDPSLRMTLRDMLAVDAGQKHVIVISDGDPSLSNSVLKDYKAAGISISTIGVYPHSTRDFNSLRTMAKQTGGTFYPINTKQALATLPQIFIKEAQTVKRALIWEGDPFSPSIVNVGAETMRGINSVPPITGYIVTADREGLSQVTMRGKENDPICAQWQYGLGRVVAFTSDATSRWGVAWVSWGSFKQFWEQHVRWAMRPSGSATLRLTTETRGDDTLVVVEAFSSSGERLNFADFKARVAKPDGSGADVEIRQIGPGRYEGLLDSSDPGSYVVSLRYRAPGDEPGQVIEGSAQAAITRPYADEFRSLESNLALLQQVAQITGGRVLEGDDPVSHDLWRREGLTMPVATTSIWLMVTLIGVGLFLVDVGVRRVRIEPRAIGAALGRALGASTSSAGDQIDSLRAAREKARQRMSERSDDRDQHATKAKRRFEADPGAPVTGAPIALGGEPLLKGTPKAQAPKPKQEDADDEGLSRLMKAKRRAQEGFDD